MRERGLRGGLRRRVRVGSLAAVVGLALCLVMGVGVALAVSSAISATDNPGYTETSYTLTTDTSYGGTTTYYAPVTYVSQPCADGSSRNCSTFGDKRDAWLSGIPLSSLANGTYFFAVLDPGFPLNANDGAPGNLSSPNDTYQAREFRVWNGSVYPTSGTSATFDASSQKLLLAPFNNSSDPNGEYTAAVCRIDQLPSYNSWFLSYDASSDPVGAKQCKYDTFVVTG